MPIEPICDWQITCSCGECCETLLVLRTTQSSAYRQAFAKGWMGLSGDGRFPYNSIWAPHHKDEDP